MTPEVITGLVGIYSASEPEIDPAEDGGTIIVYENDGKELTFTVSEDGSECYFVAQEVGVIPKKKRSSKVFELSKWLEEV